MDSPAQRRWVVGGTAGEADAVWTVIDALVQVHSTAICGANCAMDAQPLRRVQAGAMYQTSDRIEPASLHRMDCKTFAEKSGGSASPNWSATMRWMDSSRSVVGAGETMCSEAVAMPPDRGPVVVYPAARPGARCRRLRWWRGRLAMDARWPLALGEGRAARQAASGADQRTLAAFDSVMSR